jgi:release factor glutamine methyltransferase
MNQSANKITPQIKRWMLSSQHSKHKHLLKHWIQSYRRGKPLQYILGSQPFLGRQIITKQPVLIPRPETEEWTAKLIQMTKKHPEPLKILEFCTGTGCISISLALELNASMVCNDVSLRAIALAARNAKRFGADLHLVKGDMFDSQTLDAIIQSSLSIDGKRGFDMIVANPPYISPSEYERLDRTVKNWEDKRALLANDTSGVKFYNYIAQIAPLLLNDNHFASIPKILVETGHDQAHLVKQIFGREYSKIDVWKDFAGHDRNIAVYH